MKYTDFEKLMAPARMSRYLIACGHNTRKTMTLYRLNLKLSQKLFTVISCFEITLRNAINSHLLTVLGNDWLRTGAANGGIFNNPQCRLTAANITGAVNKLNMQYTHDKLVAELGFGFWRYMFAQNQYRTTGRTLLRIFPGRPSSTPVQNYNHTYVFNKLADINHLRNRIAHHEPICFLPGQPVKDTMYVRNHYAQIQLLLHWMDIPCTELLYGLDHVAGVCDQVDHL